MTKKKTEDEVIEETLPSDEERRIRVYNSNSDDDFILTLPPKCSMTFGYFNPGASNIDKYGTNRPDRQERATALRIYGPSDGLKKDQLAVFLGVKGFRDESIKLTKLVEKITVERRYVDDGEGNVESHGKQMLELTAREESIGF